MITNEVEAQQTIRMDMPGTIGGAKLIFPKDKMNQYTVKLDVTYVFDVNAESADQAAEKAKYFYKTMKHSWGEGKEDVSWIDAYPIKETIERDLDV